MAAAQETVRLLVVNRTQRSSAIFLGATFTHVHLRIFWEDGVPKYETTPHQDVGDVADLVAKHLALREGELSRRKRRVVRRWLKDYRREQTLTSLRATPSP